MIRIKDTVFLSVFFETVYQSIVVSTYSQNKDNSLVSPRAIHSVIFSSVKTPPSVHAKNKAHYSGKKRNFERLLENNFSSKNCHFTTFGRNLKSRFIARRYMSDPQLNPFLFENRNDQTSLLHIS